MKRTDFLLLMRNKLGSSLLEVLVAMALISVVLLGIAGFSTVSINGTVFSQELTQAVTLAQDKLEDIRREGYRPSVSGVVEDIEPYGSMPGAIIFQRTVETKANTPTNGLQKITVHVEWDAGAHLTSMSTILAE